MEAILSVCVSVCVYLVAIVALAVVIGGGLGRRPMYRRLTAEERKLIKQQLEREYRGKVPRHELETLEELRR